MISAPATLRIPVESVPRISAVPATRPIDVSILVVTWNSESWIERCLTSIPAACGRLNFEVLVYDNASADGSRESVERSPIDEVQLIRGSVNSGFAAGMNEAMLRSRGRMVFFLNPDCELKRGAIETLVDYLEQRPEVAAVAPILIGDDGQPQRDFQLRRFPTLRSLAADLLMVDDLFPANRARSHYRYGDLDITRPQAVEQPAAAALLVRRDACDQVGAFDERFFPAWFEDVDLCQRLWRAGLPIHVNPAAVVTHHGGASLPHVGFEDFLSTWYRNLFHYAEKWFSTSHVEALRWLIITGMILRTGALSLGMSAPISRTTAIRAHLRVLKEAFHRWDESPSS